MRCEMCQKGQSVGPGQLSPTIASLDPVVPTLPLSVQYRLFPGGWASDWATACPDARRHQAGKEV